MACFLIDYENLQGKALEGISLLGLKSTDELIFFYSKNALNITMYLHNEIEKLPCKKLYIKAKAGTQNALDFQLSSYLGACIQKYPNKKYYIVSADSGYDCVCLFWTDKNIFIRRIENLYKLH